MTQDNTPKTFYISELARLSDEELIRLLKENWAYSTSQPFDVIGRLKENRGVKGGSYFVLEDLRSINDGSAISYPLKGTDVRNRVFVGNFNKRNLDKGFLDGTWVKARVELSSAAERAKLHNNPFSLQAVQGGVKVLSDVPEEVLDTQIVIDGVHQIEQWVVDVYRQKHMDSIVKEGESLREQLDQQRGEMAKQIESAQMEFEQLKSQEGEQVAQLREEIQALNGKFNEQTDSLQDLEKKVDIARRQYRDETREFEHRKKILEHQLDTLKQFIEKKSKMLLELDLIGQDEVDGLLGRKPQTTGLQGHDFTDIFGGDAVKAVGYIQAFLYNKGIVYRRKVLEDFYALLTTHDLIILAGDSGSGKTNLVKSFAEAIGGKAVIVPVKPNWTSAEDLLGYYNPLEQKYLSTPFLDALFEAARHPDTPYFICLDEMNLARVEYYLADFLSLLEERSEFPEIPLYSAAEANHLVSEVRNFIALIDEARSKLAKQDLFNFLDLLRDEELNVKLHELCGFREGDSLLKYHASLRRMMSNYANVPSSIRLPANVRIIGAINVDETTHYLSPKVLDRAHIIRFGSPLLMDWNQVNSELKSFDLDIELPVIISTAALGEREGYPVFDHGDSLVQTLIHIVREFLDPLGIEFGLRTVRQARHYSAALQRLGASEQLILNNLVLHKILPKLKFDGEKPSDGNVAQKDRLIALRDYLNNNLKGLDSNDTAFFCVDELDRVIRNAQKNEWVVNYWSR